MAEEIKKEEGVDNTPEPHVVRLAKAMNLSMENLLPPDEDLSKKTESDPGKKVEETAEQKAEREKLEAEAKKKEEDAKAAAVVAPVKPVVLVKREEKKVDEAKQKEIDAEDDYVKTLDEDKQYEIELARHAESIKPGYSKKLIEFYRAADKYRADNPDYEGSEDYEEFIKKNEPKISNAERRKIERDMITQAATAKAREEVSKEFEPVVRELNEMKTAPTIKAVADEARAIMTKKASDDDIAIDPEVFDKIQSMPYSQAVEEYPNEAPIVASTVSKVREWTRIWNSAVEVDMKNPNHQWLMNFLQNKEAEVMAKPEADQVRDGKRFVPISKFIELEQTNPKAAAATWTFKHDDVVRMIAENGARYHKAQVQKLIKAGWARPTSGKKSATSEIEKKSEEGNQAGGGSPRAVSHTMVGAGAGAEKQDLSELPPHLRGLAKMMNTSH